MLESRLGEFAALLTALCWTFGAIAFEIACKRAGALAVNWIRLAIGFILLVVFCTCYRNLPFPTDASLRTWLWLSLSGVIGFSIGDTLLFRAFAVIGSRISMLIMSIVPPITAFLGWIVMGEVLGVLGFLGMVLTVGGILMVVLERKKDQVQSKYPLSGVLMALGGAVGQAVGLVLSKYGMGNYNAFAATQIRILAGIIGFSVLFFFLKRWGTIGQAMKDRKTLTPISIGAFLAAFLGVSFSLLAVQHTTTGVASTIMAIVPVLIIPPAVLIFKEKVSLKEVVGAFITVSGVAVLFIR